MATQYNPLATSAATSLVAAMSNLLLDTDTADIAVECGEKVWKLHSPILATRSPFFRAAIFDIMAEKKEMNIEIEGLDSETMQEVINFMYGSPIEKAPISSLFEAAKRFLMDDLKKDVIEIARNSISLKNAAELGKLAEMYNAEDFLRECAEFIVKNDVHIKKEDLATKLGSMTVSILKEALKTSNKKLKLSSGLAHGTSEAPTALAGQQRKLSCITDTSTQREEMVECFAPYDDHKWDNIGKLRDGMAPSAVQYARALRPAYHLLSFLRIQGNSIMGMSSTDKNIMVYMCLEGEVTVIVNTTKFSAKKGDSFYVLPKNKYNLVNEKALNAELSLVQYQYDGPPSQMRPNVTRNEV